MSTVFRKVMAEWDLGAKEEVGAGEVWKVPWVIGEEATMRNAVHNPTHCNKSQVRSIQ